MDMPPTDPTGGRTDAVVVGLAALLHLVVAVFPLAASGLLAPAWFLVVVGLGWLAGGAVLWRLRRTAPRRTPLVPVATVAAWFVLVTLGDLLLGWTA